MLTLSRLIAALLVGLLALTPAAVAQSSSMAMSIFSDEGTFSPELTRGDLDVFKRVLSMKPDEVDAMEQLYGAYCNTLKTEGMEVRRFVAEKMEESEVMADTRLLDPARKRLADWAKRSEELKKSFMEDLKALLTRDQEARWPIVERELRRIKLLGHGRLPGEEPDLVKLVEDLPAEAKKSAVFADLLERYSQDMDRAIQSRSKFLDENKEKFDDLVEADPLEAKKLFERATREREGVVSVNERYLRDICAELSPQHAQELKDRYFKLSYSLLAKGTRGERYIRAAGKLDNLTTEQRAHVDAILAEYERERRVIVEKMAEIVREQKLTRLPEKLERKLNPPAPDAPDENRNRNEWDRGLPEGHPMRGLRRARYELDRSFRARIDALLTPEQRDRLPDQALEPVTYYEDSPWGL